MAKRAVDYRRPKLKFLAVECPNPLHKWRGKTGLANVLPNGTLPGRVLDVAQSVIFGESAHFDAKAATPRRATMRKGLINTASIERDNLILCPKLCPLARKILGFTNNRREAQPALHFINAPANIVKPHQSLRGRASRDSGPRWVPPDPCRGRRTGRHLLEAERLACYKHQVPM